MNNNYIILDLDGTISKSGERNIFFTTDPRNYKAAEAAVIYDEVIEPVRSMITHFVEHGSNVIVLTARSKSCQANCETWLKANDIPYSDIFLRPDGDYSKDYVVKEKLLHDIIEKYGQPSFAVEDRPDVIDMFKRNGIFVFGVHAL